MVDFDESLHSKTKTDGRIPSNSSDNNASPGTGAPSNPNVKKVPRNEDDDVFSDSDGTPRNRRTCIISDRDGPNATRHAPESSTQRAPTRGEEPAQQRHLENTDSSRVGNSKPDNGGTSEFKVVAADASVFTFGDEEDYESE